MTHKVSVYITTQNRPLFLRRSLESLSKQTFRDFEVLICNDASDKIHDEEYEKVIKEYTEKFSSLFYIKNDQIKGACYSRNLLIKEASGEFITGLDDDDIFHPERLDVFVNFPNLNEFSFICSSVQTLAYKNEFKIEREFSGKIIDLSEMKNYNVVGNQVFIKRSLLKEVGAFDVNMPAWQDYDTWFRVIESFGPAFKIDSVTMFLDVSEDRKRITTSSNAYSGYLKFIGKHAELLNDRNLISLKYMDLINRKESFSLLNIELLLNPSVFVRVFKYKSVYTYPKLYSIYVKILKRK